MGNVMDGMTGDPVTDKSTERGSSGDFSFAASGMKGWRATMEDSHTMCSNVQIHQPDEDGGPISLVEHSVFCVYDGHGGGMSSKYAGNHFVRILSERDEMKRYAAMPDTGSRGKDDANGIELLKGALHGAFLDLDRELRHEQQCANRIILEEHLQTQQQQQKKQQEAQGNTENGETKRSSSPPPRPASPTKLSVERSGSTVVVVMITPSHIICANAGDSRAILRREGSVLPLSFDHKPNNVPEHERIIDTGGFVKNKRVNGDLAVSRGFGDFTFKNENCDDEAFQNVIPHPDILVYPRDVLKDEFIVLACDGIWDVVSSEECGNMIQEIMDEGETDLGLICEEMLDQCLAKNSRDNMTLVMVSMPAIKIQTSQLKIRNAVWARRASRHAKSMELRAKETMESMMKSGNSTEEATVATIDPVGKQGAIPIVANSNTVVSTAASKESRNDDGGSSPKSTSKRNEESSSAFSKPVQSKGTTAREV